MMKKKTKTKMGTGGKVGTKKKMAYGGKKKMGYGGKTMKKK